MFYNTEDALEKKNNNKTIRTVSLKITTVSYEYILYRVFRSNTNKTRNVAYGRNPVETVEASPPSDLCRSEESKYYTFWDDFQSINLGAVFVREQIQTICVLLNGNVCFKRNN